MKQVYVYHMNGKNDALFNLQDTESPKDALIQHFLKSNNQFEPFNYPRDKEILEKAIIEGQYGYTLGDYAIDKG